MGPLFANFASLDSLEAQGRAGLLCVGPNIILLDRSHFSGDLSIYKGLERAQGRLLSSCLFLGSASRG